MTSEKGKSHDVDSESGVGGWEQRQRSGSSWGGQSPCFGLGELPSLVPMRVSPQARGQTHFALTPLCKQLGVLLAVLLPQKALPTSNFPTHLTTVRGERGSPMTSLVWILKPQPN